MSKYVKIKDKGAVFFDPSQQVKVSGTLPYKIQITKKVELALKGGILVDVPEAEALKQLEKEATRLEEIANARNVVKQPITSKKEDKAVEELNAKLEALKSENKTLLEDKKSVEELNAELSLKLEDAETKLKALPVENSSEDNTEKETKGKGNSNKKPDPNPAS